MATAKSIVEPESPLARLFTRPDHHQDSSPTSRLSGPGTSRQTRRLQLRNQKFRGATMPARKPSPNSRSPGRQSSTCSSDTENHSPADYRGDRFEEDHTYGHGVLQELGNAGRNRRENSSSKHRSSSSFDRIASPMTFGDILSPSQRASATVRVSPNRSRSSRMLTQRAYRAVSEETTAYIDHLEAQLAAAQAQATSLDAVNTAREQSNRVRALSTEVRHLQEIITAWENQYEQRIHEAVSSYAESEIGLKAQIRSLENSKDESAYRIAELEEQLASASSELEAVEIANTNLEKRLEIMSSLLASSPTRLDFQSESPDRDRRTRPRSMVPGFSNTTSLQNSPQRVPQHHPISPNFSLSSSNQETEASPENALETPQVQRLSEKPSFVSTVASSDAASIFSEAAMSSVDSIASAEVPDEKLHSDHWHLLSLWSARTKAGRRMRRFGAGSSCPKPLILPSTNQNAHLSPPFAFVPPLDACTYQGSIPEAAWASAEGQPSGLNSYLSTPVNAEGEERMSSPALTNTTANLEKLYQDDSATDTCTESQIDTPARKCSQNLQEELEELDSSDNKSIKTYSNRSTRSSSLHFDKRGRTFRRRKRSGSSTSVSLVRENLRTLFKRHSPHAEEIDLPSMTGELVPLTTSSYTFVFTDLWNSPLVVIRSLIHLIQSRLSVPKPLLDCQWAAVGVLLGPLAQRRLLCQPPPSNSEADQWNLLDSYNGPGAKSCLACSSSREVVDEIAQPDPPMQSGCPTPCATHKSSPGNPLNQSSRSVTVETIEDSPQRVCLEEQTAAQISTYGPWLWLKFSFTLAVAVGIAFKDGPGSLMVVTECVCNSKRDQPSSVTPAVASASVPQPWNKKLRRRRTYSPGEDSESD